MRSQGRSPFGDCPSRLSLPIEEGSVLTDKNLHFEKHVENLHCHLTTFFSINLHFTFFLPGINLLSIALLPSHSKHFFHIELCENFTIFNSKRKFYYSYQLKNPNIYLLSHFPWECLKLRKNKTKQKTQQRKVDTCIWPWTVGWRASYTAMFPTRKSLTANGTPELVSTHGWAKNDINILNDVELQSL